jgi:anti-sigma regulatory factor (Ser/Thr protein kinase)
MVGHRLSLNPDVAEIPRLNDWIERRCGEAGLGDEFSSRLMLALEEAAMNVIAHAFEGMTPPHRIDIQLDITADTVAATVVDNGRPFDPTIAPEPDLSVPLEQRDPGGLGILLIHRMVDRVEYRRSNGRNRLRLEKARGS